MKRARGLDEFVERHFICGIALLFFFLSFIIILYQDLIEVFFFFIFKFIVFCVFYLQDHQVLSQVHHPAHHAHIQMETAMYSFHAVATAAMAAVQVVHRYNHQHQAFVCTMTTDPLNGHPEIPVHHDEGKYFQKITFL